MKSIRLCEGFSYSCRWSSKDYEGYDGEEYNGEAYEGEEYEREE